MTFKNARFPTGIRLGATAKRAFNTSIAMAQLSGRSQRDSRRSSPLRSFRVERALHTDALQREFIAFHSVMNGPGDTFRIKDFSDYTAAGVEGVFTDLGNNQFQMWKRHTVAGVALIGSPLTPQTYTKDILVLLPVEGTVVIPGFTETTHYTIDYTTPSGIVTIVGSPGDTPSSWTGEYDVLVRFENDELMYSADTPDLLMSQAINIVEEPL